MIVYHGTTLKITEPRILRSEIGRDFGPAFYTTDITFGIFKIITIRRMKVNGMQ